jgi:hypothetical protein
VIQVLAKPSVANGLSHVDVGGGDQPDVNGDRRGAADPRHGPLVKESQKAPLGVETEMGDPFQKERAVVRQLEAAPAIERGVCADGRIAIMAEQLAFNRAVGNPLASDPDEWPLAPGAEVMQGPGDEFVSGARFSRDQGGSLGIRDAVDRVG